METESKEITGRTGVVDPLLEGIRTHCVYYGKFKLVSGRKSDIYLDLKSFLISPLGSYLVAERLMWMLERDNFPQAVGAVPVGGYPIVSALSTLMGQRYYRNMQLGFPWPPHYATFYLREKPKDHGAQQHTEGYKIEEGDEVVLVDDVLTTGETLTKYIEKIKQMGATVKRVYIVVDREEHGELPFEVRPMYSFTTVMEEEKDDTLGEY